MIFKALVALAFVVNAGEHVSNKKVNPGSLYKQLRAAGAKVTSMRCGEDENKPDECHIGLAADNSVDVAAIVEAHVFRTPEEIKARKAARKKPLSNRIIYLQHQLDNEIAKKEPDTVKVARLVRWIEKRRAELNEIEKGE